MEPLTLSMPFEIIWKTLKICMMQSDAWQIYGLAGVKPTAWKKWNRALAWQIRFDEAAKKNLAKIASRLPDALLDSYVTGWPC